MIGGNIHAIIILLSSKAARTLNQSLTVSVTSVSLVNKKEADPRIETIILNAIILCQCTKANQLIAISHNKQLSTTKKVIESVLL